MRTRKFKVQPNFLTAGSDVPRAGEGVPAGGREIHRRPSAVEVFVANGIPFPEGASATFIPAANLLIVHNTKENLDLVEALLEELHSRTPTNVHATLFIAQASSETLRGIVTTTTALADHTPALAALEKLTEEGSAQIPVVLRFETRSGQRATIGSGVAYAYAGDLLPVPPRETDAAKDGNPSPKAGTPPAPSQTLSAEILRRLVGTRVELDPVIGPDGHTVDVNFALEHHFAPPALPKSAPAGAGAQGTLVELPGAEFHCAKVTSAITLGSGTTKLIGVWKAEGAPELEGKDVMQAAFLRVDVVPVRKE
jgi:hypothetical protein